eukprot:TRINITY_DN9713_c0_g1_i1.p1 TRINITY_DN9713_c0_g1~~TRINITY_DN9713_c0_g1_i1.p1  ORF type:complete len:284 (-),score=29.46 TRINITY_DN9713_c0_g1_i1:41-892(-)
MESNDNYEHVDPMLIYTPGNVPGPSFSEDNFVELDNGCFCTTDCGVACFHQGSFSVGSYECGLLNTNNLGRPVFECNSKCECEPSRCLNRVVTHGPHPRLKVCRTSGKGYGLFCDVDLQKGEFVCEYAGEILDDAGAKRRFEAQTRQKRSNYILVLREFSGSSLTCKTIVDPTAMGNIGRYANHSCEANLVVLPVRIETVIPHVAMFTNRFVPKGEELCFDYGDPGGSRIFENTRSLTSGPEGIESRSPTSSVDDIESRTPCECRSAKCRLFLPFDKDLLMND